MWQDISFIDQHKNAYTSKEYTDDSKVITERWTHVTHTHTHTKTSNVDYRNKEG